MLTLLSTLAMFLVFVFLLWALITLSGRKLKETCGSVEGSSCSCKAKGQPSEDCNEKYSIEM